MTRPSELAARYGTSTTFVHQALAQLGIATDGDTNMSQAVVERFEARFGAKIRASRPEPPAPITPLNRRARAQQRPHIIRTAYEKVTGQRNPVTRKREKALLDPPGIAHALDAAGTWDRDPWGGMPSEEVRSLSSRLPINDPHFYDRGGPHAACGVRLRALVVDEFDVEASTACPRCAELVAAGKAYRYPSEPRNPTFCSGFIRVKRGQLVSFIECSLRYEHEGPHEARTGETWPRRADGAAVLADA